jgi:hypothetical protein
VKEMMGELGGVKTGLSGCRLLKISGENQPGVLGVVQTCGRKKAQKNKVDQAGIRIDQVGKPMDELRKLAGHTTTVIVAGRAP